MLTPLTAPIKFTVFAIKPPDLAINGCVQGKPIEDQSMCTAYRLSDV